MEDGYFVGSGLEGATGGEGATSKLKRGLCGLAHHRRSSSLVSDATIEAAIAVEEGKPQKCPRLRLDVCSSPGSITAAGIQAVAETRCDQPATPCSKCTMANQKQQSLQSVLAVDVAVQAVAEPTQPINPAGVSNSLTHLPDQHECTVHDAPDMQLHQHVNVLHNNTSSLFGTQDQPAAAGFCPKTASALLGCMVPVTPVFHLDSLSLVASRLAGSSGAANGGIARSCSPLLPATQATLEATTANVVAAEALATAAAAAADVHAGQSGCQLYKPWTALNAKYEPAAAALQHISSSPVSADVHKLAKSTEQPSDATVAEQQAPANHQKMAVAAAAVAHAVAEGGQVAALAAAAKPRVEIPAWLCSSSTDLEASAAICRASLLSTSAALARLCQQPLRPAPPAAAAHANQVGIGASGAPAATPAHVMHTSTVLAASAWGAAPAVQGPAVRANLGIAPVALGVPVCRSSVVVGQPAAVGAAPAPAAVVARSSPGGWRQHLFDFSSAGAGELRCATLSAHGMQCNDASSCSSTPRMKPATADTDATVQAAAELLSSQRPRRRCCWEPAEWEDEEQWGIAVCDMVEVASPPTPTIPAVAAAVAAAAVAQEGAHASEHTDVLQLAKEFNGADAATPCAVVVVVDIAPKRRKEQWQQGGAGYGETGSVGVPAAS